jgi:alkyl hydroperoxide reductase subunit AhpC/membrane protein DedA with SNARE-associated domain
VLSAILASALHAILRMHGAAAYGVVAALCFGEAAFFLGFVLPGETAVVLGGVLAAEHRVSLPAMCAVVVAAAIAGDTVGYEVGRLLGPVLLRHRPLRGHPGVERTRELLARRGGAAVFLGRFVAIFRALMPGVAGLSGMRYRVFLAFNAAGGLCWGLAYTLAGFAVGRSYEVVLRDAGSASTGILVASAVVGGAVLLWHRVRAHRRLLVGAASPGKSDPEDRQSFRDGLEWVKNPQGSGGQLPHARGRGAAGGDGEVSDAVGHGTRRGGDMALQLGDVAPDFTAETTEGTIHFHEWLGDHWGVLFSHPKDFTPVCTTELGEVARLKPEFDKRNTKVIGLSVDAVADHHSWAGDIADATGHALNFPLIGDPDHKVADLYGMIHPNAADTFTVRSVFIIGPDKKVKLTITYPASVGRNFDEILRVLDALQLTEAYKVSTPVNWRDGDEVIVAPALSDDEAKERFPKGFRTVKPYLRFTPQPNR